MPRQTLQWQPAHVPKTMAVKGHASLGVQPSDNCFALGAQRQQAKETELRHELVELQGRERTAQSEVESKNQDIESVQRELGRLKGGPCHARPIRELDSLFAPVSFRTSSSCRLQP